VAFDATLTAPGVSREDFVVTGKLGGGPLVVNGRVLAQGSNGSLPTSMGGVPAKTSLGKPSGSTTTGLLICSVQGSRRSRQRSMHVISCGQLAAQARKGDGGAERP
jgi:hypothetical protein